ncbi:hypothetical protein SAMN04488508_1021 [Aquimarina spongiae]|uniref:Uncharacterized protein n=1 Tax=Aquimarina spongiae TaxID=570521 RepID=A0A1M6C8M1_9FLAO|nr:hypothetical protein SAMN04488508_1021 [Aquimarina spongiae]
MFTFLKPRSSTQFINNCFRKRILQQFMQDVYLLILSTVLFIQVFPGINMK